MTAHRRPAVRAMLIAAALSLAGCEVGPDYHTPAPPNVTGYTTDPRSVTSASPCVAGGDAQRFVQGLDIPGQWWTLFHSPELNDLVEPALRKNPDLDAARAALRQANENVRAGEGGLFPTLTANGQAARERISGAEFGQPNLSEQLSLVTPALNISYAPDVFGGTRRGIEQLAAQSDTSASS